MPFSSLCDLIFSSLTTEFDGRLTHHFLHLTDVHSDGVVAASEQAQLGLAAGLLGRGGYFGLMLSAAPA